MNQKGFAVPMIVIIAGVVILVAILATLLKFATSGTKSSPSPAGTGTSLNLQDPKYKNCADRDYTGCDGKEVFTWKDDGKR